QQKRRNETEECEVVIRSAGKRHSIEHKDSSRAERLRGDSVFLAFQKQAANEKADANHKSYGNAQLRWNQVVFKRIFHEERHAEEKREPADPRKELRTHELLPIDRRFARHCDLRNRW